ncbi:MAG: hypothetical protein MZU79_01240 [Anaerotruncus sp.]|nr:hypothetical protein [Anaerotruncus sp.]
MIKNPAASRPRADAVHQRHPAGFCHRPGRIPPAAPGTIRSAPAFRLLLFLFTPGWSSPPCCAMNWLWNSSAHLRSSCCSTRRS